MKRIKIDPVACAGCRQCEMVCSFHHTGVFSPSLARVTVHKDDRDGLDYPVMCHQCTDCPPAQICPTGAITKTVEGVTTVDTEKCIGCGACAEACKYDAIKIPEKAIICDLCGGEPVCVIRCPTGALEYVEAPESTSTPITVFDQLRRRWGFE